MTTAKDIAVTALNILDGMEHHTHWEELAHVWDNAGYGFVEFCCWISDVAEMVNEQLVEKGEQDFPGVFDYEVSCELGELIRHEMLTHKMLPSKNRLHHLITVLIDQFFEQGREYERAEAEDWERQQRQTLWAESGGYASGLPRPCN
jgi:hypothetical protein